MSSLKLKLWKQIQNVTYSAKYKMSHFINPITERLKKEI